MKLKAYQRQYLKAIARGLPSGSEDVAIQKVIDDHIQRAMLDRQSGADPVEEQLTELLKTKKEISTSMLQVKLGIGYVRAARIMERLEQEGSIGPVGKGSARRRITRQSA